MSEQLAPVVVLDPGHGGRAGVGGSSPNNATGPNGLLEKDLTLDLAQRTAAALAGRARVLLTRTGDVNLSLADRAAVARAANADVFLSIHLNGFQDRSVDGTEVWVARAAGQASADLGQSVLHRLLAVTQVRDRGVRRADLGVLLPQRHAPGTAACLAEIAFLTNPAQANRLADTTYRQQIAQALASAVLDRVRVPVLAGAPAPAGAPTAAQAWAGPPVFSSTYARTAAIVEPDVDYRATSLAEANAIWEGWLARYAEWAKGVPDGSLTNFPHAAICQLRLFEANGRRAYGTGFYIGPETLLTCGHNFMNNRPWRTIRVEVQPGHSPRLSTFATGTFSVHAADVVHPQWRDSYDPTHDLAVLRVPGLPAQRGIFSLANRSLGPNEGIVVCGYGKVEGQSPEEQGQRMDGAHIAEADAEMVYYPIQTVGGHSGSPVFHGSTVIGVHTGPRQPGGVTDTHQNRAVLINPEKIDWINRQGGTSFGLGMAGNGYSLASTYAEPRAYALVDQNSPQSAQSLEVRRHIALSLRQAETSVHYDDVSHDSNRVNFGIASWTGAEIADLFDVYVTVANQQGAAAAQAMFAIFGNEANFIAMRDLFRSQGKNAVLTPAQETQLRQLGATTTLQDAQIRKLADDVKGMLGRIGDQGNPWYPWIDAGMGAISEVAAHVLVHAMHQSGNAGFRRVLRDAIAHFGGEQAVDAQGRLTNPLGQHMVDGTVTERDFLHQVGEEVASHVLPHLQRGVRNRYRTLSQNYSGSHLAYYFHPAN